MADEGVTGAPASVRPRPPREDRGRRPSGTFRRVGSLVVAAVVAVQVCLGAVWWMADVTAIPEYGDTTEYLALSDTLEVDSFRTLFYPLLVRGAREAGGFLGVPWVSLLYAVQLAVAVAATAFLVRSLAPRLPRWTVAVVTAALVTLPLPLHYTATVLTDSLAASFLLLVVAGLVRWAAHDDLGLLTVVAMAGGTVLSVLMRPDRLYIVAAVAAVTAVVVVLRRTRRGAGAAANVRAALSTGAVLVLALVLPAVGASAANRATQTAQTQRPPVTLVGTLYDRVAYPNLDVVRDDLPPRLAEAVPPAPPHVTSPVAWRVETLNRLRDVDGDDAVMEVVGDVLDCCTGEVVAHVARDVGYALLGPYAVSGDVLTGSSLTPWNISRMSQHRPDLSRAVVGWSVVATATTAALTAALLVGAARRRTPAPQGLGVASLVLGATAFALAGAFGLVSSIPVNTRYTLVTQVVLCALPLVWLAHVRVDGRPRRARESGPTPAAIPSVGSLVART